MSRLVQLRRVSLRKNDGHVTSGPSNLYVCSALCPWFSGKIVVYAMKIGFSVHFNSLTSLSGRIMLFLSQKTDGNWADKGEYISKIVYPSLCRTPSLANQSGYEIQMNQPPAPSYHYHNFAYVLLEMYTRYRTKLNYSALLVLTSSSAPSTASGSAFSCSTKLSSPCSRRAISSAVSSSTKYS